MKKIILCGGSGYIGTKLTEHLLDNTNYEIVIVDRLDFKLENEFKTTRYSNDRVTFHQKDIRNLDFMESIIKEDSYVVNLAALVGEPLCKIKPDEAVEVNYEAAKNLAELCKEKNVKKIFTKAKTAGFWDDLSIEQRKEIETASREIENGEITDYESFMQKHR